MKFRRAILAMILALPLLASVGCNTIEGAGKDISATGEAISNVADDAKP